VRRSGTPHSHDAALTAPCIFALLGPSIRGETRGCRSCIEFSKTCTLLENWNNYPKISDMRGVIILVTGCIMVMPALQI
jgi:hypothetical protein